MHLIRQVFGNTWKENIVLSSVPLWKYENEIPIANASGCLINYKDKIFLISIAHATIANSEWRIEVTVEKIDGEFGTILQPVEMQPLVEFKLTPERNDFTEPKIVDFTYKKLPDNFKSTHCFGITKQNQLQLGDRTIFKPKFNSVLTPEKQYGFYGKVRFKGVEGRFMKFEHRIESDLRYIGRENEFFVFKLSHKYGSHENYIGCSGAPIIDSDNNLVALVSYGLKSTNCIYGIDIEKYKAALDIEII